MPRNNRFSETFFSRMIDEPQFVDPKELIEPEISEMPKINHLQTHFITYADYYYYAATFLAGIIVGHILWP